MQIAFWLVLIAAVAVFCGTVWYSLRKLKERQAAEEQRLAEFMAATAGRAKMIETPAPVPSARLVAGATQQSSPLGDIAKQKLLFESAHKAGEAGEPALAIQLYARLLARFPQSAFADQARAGVEAQEKKIAKA